MVSEIIPNFKPILQLQKRHEFRFGRNGCLSFKCAIEIRRFRFKFCTAGVYHFINPTNTQSGSFIQHIFIRAVAM